MKLWISLCKQAEYIVDIGANSGVYALVAKSINPNAKVFAFEPQPMFYKRLLKNVEINNFNIACYNYAISDVNDSIIIGNYAESNKFINVTAITLDAFIESQSIPKIDLMKIDVEMHEPFVLRGFFKYLKIFQPVIIIEILNDEIANKIEQLVSDCNYLYFNINEQKGVKQTKHLEKSDSFNYLLCNEMVAKYLGFVETN